MDSRNHFKYSDQEKQINTSDVIYIKMLEDFLTRNNLFYSDNMDLTTNMQKTFEKLEGRKEESLNSVRNTCKNEF